MAEQLLGVGQVFAERYRIERPLASGGFGAVFVAEQIATENRVALKILRPHILDSKAFVAGFQQEARIAARVNSEHIVRVLDAGFDAKTCMPYLVMELLEGRDLGRVVNQSGPLPPRTVLALMRQVASALDKAHGYVDRHGTPRPIIHRDLKPENLFLTTRESGQPLVKVLDFGIAKVVSATANVSEEIKGTPLYMAYEQAGGERVMPQTDVWSLGLVVFFLLIGRNYWKSASSPEVSMTQVFAEVLNLPIVPPSSRLTELGVAASLPEGFDAWFLRCVDRDPQRRFPSAGAAVAALGEVFGDAQGPAVRGAATPLELASTIAATTGSAAALLGRPGPAASGDATLPAPAGAQTAAPIAVSQAGSSSRGAGRGLLVGIALLLAVVAVAGAYLAGRDGSRSATPVPPSAMAKAAHSAARAAAAPAAHSAAPAAAARAAHPLAQVARSSAPPAAHSAERAAATSASAKPRPVDTGKARPARTRKDTHGVTPVASVGQAPSPRATPSSAPATSTSSRSRIYGLR